MTVLLEALKENEQRSARQAMRAWTTHRHRSIPSDHPHSFRWRHQNPPAAESFILSPELWIRKQQSSWISCLETGEYINRH
jgi:hypothetical protein